MRRKILYVDPLMSYFKKTILISAAMGQCYYQTVANKKKKTSLELVSVIIGLSILKIYARM